MRGTFVVFCVIAASLVLPAIVSAKGDTVRITITGRDLAAPVVIVDTAVAARFHVWSGPGTSSNEAQGLNVDWSGGVADPPKDIELYEVSFVTTRRDRGTYVVRYGRDPSTNLGYVYLPGKADAAYRNNVWLIYRGIEGNWFHAWGEWEKLVHPLIDKARTAR